jgi:rubrerythrin
LINEQELTIVALKSAIQMEIEGKEFYLKMSGISGEITGRKLFQSLAAEEDRHRQKFETIFQSIASQKGWPDILVEPHADSLTTVFAVASQRAQFTRTELEAVQTAMEMENKTRDFYLARSEKAEYPAEKLYYTSLAKEERIHHNLLQDYFEYMQNPAQYFTVKEKHSLDGG